MNAAHSSRTEAARDAAGLATSIFRHDKSFGTADRLDVRGAGSKSLKKHPVANTRLFEVSIID